MPYYDYMCTECGPFTELKPMAEASIPCRCPSCSQPSPRAYLRAPNVGLVSTAVRTAHETNERASHDPKRHNKSAHGPGCSCCSGKSSTKNATPDGRFKRGGTRPWQISH